MPKLIDIAGQRFGKLVVQRLAVYAVDGRRGWVCACDCGGSIVVGRAALIHPRPTVSCGCGYTRGKPHRAPERVVAGITEDQYMPEPNSGCWLWLGVIVSGQGYGRILENGRYVLAHRVSYAMAKGPIPEGLYIDHICRNRGCVNPDHLRAVTPQINSIENNPGITAINAAKTHCKCGLPYAGDNLHIKRNRSGKFVQRVCLACRRAEGRAA